MMTNSPGALPVDIRDDLSAVFPSSDAAEWRTAAEAVLKGGSFEKLLGTPVPEGFSLKPIYGPGDAGALPHRQDYPGGNGLRGFRAAGARWAVSQELPCSTPDEFNAAARSEIERGQDELQVLLDLATAGGRDPDHASPGEVGACGLSLATLKDFERAFADLPLERTAVYFRTGAIPLPTAGFWLALLERRKVPLETARGGFETDPLSVLAWSGRLPITLDRGYDDMAALTRGLERTAPGLQTIAVNATCWHEAGANAVEELAFAMATGVEYVRALGRRGVAPPTTIDRLRLTFSFGQPFFTHLAKMRAARVLWSKVVGAFASGHVPLTRFHARTSMRNRTVYDPHVNLLRSTAEAFSAVAAGCDGLHIGAFDEAYSVPDAFSRRLARNTHFVLAEECGFDRVMDPAGGSWFVEWLTDQLASRAWELFQEIEAEGGFAQSLAAGRPQARAAASATREEAGVAQRRLSLIGINRYPNPAETRREGRSPDYERLQRERGSQVAHHRVAGDEIADGRVMEELALLTEANPDEILAKIADAATVGATLGEVGRTIHSDAGVGASAPPLMIRRLAAPFERLRTTVERAVATDKSAMEVTLIQLGPSRLYRARADWTAGFFRVGGFPVRMDREFAAGADAAAFAVEARPRCAVLVGLDATYTAMAKDVARAIKKVHPDTYLLLAGNPGDAEGAYRESGIDGFVHIRTRCLEFLQDLAGRLDI